jgi:hypothetical protein
MRKRFVCILLCVVLFSQIAAFAWNNIGHMAVAYVAWQNLTPAMRARVTQLVQQNPLYSKWDQLIPVSVVGTQRNMYLFMIAATWPDQIKGMSSQFSCNGTSNTDTPPAGEAASLNTGYTDTCLHKYWHFIDESYAIGGAANQPVPAPNAIQKIDAYTTNLGANLPDDVKSYDLVWLEHLVGDVHQPLHCVTRYTKNHPQGDAGGNKVSLGSSKELHGYWDNILGNKQSDLYKDAKRAETVAKALPAVNSSSAASPDTATWKAESVALAKSTTYKKPPIGPEWGPYSSTTTYHTKALNTSQQRVSVAGMRLAELINTHLQ